jgi:hypothetical protein
MSTMAARSVSAFLTGEADSTEVRKRNTGLSSSTDEALRASLRIADREGDIEVSKALRELLARR